MTRRRIFTGHLLATSLAIAASLGWSGAALAQAKLKVAAVYTVPFEQQWVSRIDKALKAAVQTYPNTDYDLAEVLTSLGTGEAIVTVMDEDGAPTPVAWTKVRAPQGSMNPMPAESMAATARVAAPADSPTMPMSNGTVRSRGSMMKPVTYPMTRYTSALTPIGVSAGGARSKSTPPRKPATAPRVGPRARAIATIVTTTRSGVAPGSPSRDSSVTSRTTAATSSPTIRTA